MPLFIEVPVPGLEIEQSCILVLFLRLFYLIVELFLQLFIILLTSVRVLRRFLLSKMWAPIKTKAVCNLYSKAKNY